MDQQDNLQVEIQDQDSKYLQAMFLYLYFMQGLIYSISITIPYIYPILPTYSQLSLFYSSMIPWTFKFVISPFLQKYTSLEYGKRKTWLVVSKLLAGVLLIVCSKYTAMQHIVLCALILIAINFVMVFHNISSESLAIKEFKNKQRIGIIQTVSELIGMAFGSIFFMKMTNLQFAQKLGLKSSITTPSTIFIIYSILLLISVIPIHTFFSQRKLDSQNVSKSMQICKIISYNKVFFNYESKYFRMGVFFIIYHIGITIYFAGFEFQLVNKGFSRNTYNTLENICTIIVSVLAFYMQSITDRFNGVMTFSFMILISILGIIPMVIFVPIKPWIVFISITIQQIAYAFRKIIIYSMANTLPLHGVSGMFLTTLTSLMWFGQCRTIPTELIDLFGFNTTMIFGLIYQFIILLVIPNIFHWIEEGKVEVDSDIIEKQEYQEMEN